MPSQNGKGRKRRPNRPADPKPHAYSARLDGAPPAGSGTDRFAPTAWAQRDVELELPSGQICLVRRMPLQQMVEEGIIDNFDRLTSLVQEKHVSKKARSSGPPQKQMNTKAMMAAITSSPTKMREIFEITDRVVMAIVVAPKILPVPEDGVRESGAAYIDWVGEEDKAYVMQFAFGGTRDLERFRGELAELGDGVDIGEDVEDET
jgi:hypothetical protein